MSNPYRLDRDAAGDLRFAHNKDIKSAHLSIGTQVDGYADLDTMLAAAGANFEVKPAPLFAEVDGHYVPVSTPHHVGVRKTTDFVNGEFVDTITTFTPVGTGYVWEQNREAGEFAMACAGAAPGDACIDMMAVLDHGETFYALVALEPLVLDPFGINDTIERYIAVANGHGGQRSLTTWGTNQRTICANELGGILYRARKDKGTYKVKHTANKEQRKLQAIEAMGVATKMNELFKEQAETLLRLSGGHDVLDQVIKAVWAKPEAKVDEETLRITNGRAIDNWNERRSVLHRLYELPTNSPAVGDNAWAVFNTVGEYLDHFRPNTTVRQRALASIDPESSVNGLRSRAAGVLLGV